MILWLWKSSVQVGIKLFIQWFVKGFKMLLSWGTYIRLMCQPGFVMSAPTFCRRYSDTVATASAVASQIASF